MRSDSDNAALRYIEASRVQGPAGDLASLDLCDMNNQRIGSLEGVLVDPIERRLRFFVVGSQSADGARFYLLPSDLPAQVDPDRGALRIDADPDELAECHEFEEADVPRYSDDDFLASMFRPRVA